MALQQIMKKEKERKPGALDKAAQGLGIAVSLGKLATDINKLDFSKLGTKAGTGGAPVVSTTDQAKEIEMLKKRGGLLRGT